MPEKLKIANSEICYSIVYRNVKYPRLEFKTGSLLLIMPNNSTESKEVILQKHGGWILEKHREIISAIKASKNKKISTISLDEFKPKAKEIAMNYLRKRDIKANNISFKTMVSKWASCSARKNISLNTQLCYLPERLQKYVIFHEIIHLEEKRHNERFWKLISEEFRDYAAREKDLFRYWFLINSKK